MEIKETDIALNPYFKNKVPQSYTLRTKTKEYCAKHGTGP